MTHFDNTVQAYEQPTAFVNEKQDTQNALGVEALRLLDKESARRIDTSDGWAPGSVQNAEGKKVYASWAVQILDAGEYTAKSGDNLQQIAKRSLGVTGNPDASPKEVQAEVKRIVKLNEAEHPELKYGKVDAGTTLNLKGETSSQYLEIPAINKAVAKGSEPQAVTGDKLKDFLEEKRIIGRDTPEDLRPNTYDSSEAIQFKPFNGIKFDDLQDAFDEFIGRRPKFESLTGIPDSQRSPDPLTSQIQDKLYAKLSPEQQKQLTQEMREHEKAIQRWAMLDMINAPYPEPGKLLAKFNANVAEVTVQAHLAASKAVDSILAKGARQRH